MNDPKKVPLVSKELVEWLEKLYPERCPDPADTERAIWMTTGAVQVVRKLRKTHTEQCGR